MNGSLTRFAWLSIAAAILTIGLKLSAYFLTGSVSLLSDALESLVNLATAIVALIALTIAARPPDADHPFGHDKIEYFSSGFEGSLILFAAFSIAIPSIQRLLDPQPLEQIGIGLIITVIAAAINLAVARVLFRVAHTRHSVTLQADAQHLMTDVWTSGGIVIGIGLVALSGWTWLDPVIALFVALNILRSGLTLLQRSFYGLMDTAIPPEDRAQVEAILQRYEQDHGIGYHALRTRQSGARRFISVHILVPPEWTVAQGHHLLDELEDTIRIALPHAIIGTHLEPLGDPASIADISLERDR
ncbi:MAG: cation diffusion facilitator family transporter [Anaerolineae bacterium]|jgi:cation diffusion facilitator family transporter|nr:cation diffusion facilitator family transporter [Anaerolineae bacterium]